MFASQTSDCHIMWMQSDKKVPKSIQEIQPGDEETGLGTGVTSNSWDWGPWAEPK